VQVTDHQQLHPAERQIIPAAASKNAVHPVKQICSDHADFIDNQKIKASDDILFLPPEPVPTGMRFTAGDKGTKRHLKKGMQGDAAGIDGRDTGRSRYHQPFMRFFLNGMEKGGFAGAGFAGQKDMAVGMLDKFFGDPEFGSRDVHFIQTLLVARFMT
jgi:hypothetical protein